MRNKTTSVDIDIATGEIVNNDNLHRHSNSTVYRLMLRGSLITRAEAFHTLITTTSVERSTIARLQGIELPWAGYDARIEQRPRS